MYIPPAFNQTDLATLHGFIQRHSFAVLCSTGDDGVPFVSHVPLLLDRDAAPLGVLIGHVARANPQWRHADGRPVLAVFSGPHVYVSPAWYRSQDVVPTWNYAAVHAVGILRVVEDPDTLLSIVRDMVTFFESGRPEPWQIGDRNDYLDRMLRGIVGFRIEISHIEGKWKLSQNHPEERRERVIGALRARGGEDATAIADMMARVRR
jgi:transcriptional regulator